MKLSELTVDYFVSYANLIEPTTADRTYIADLIVSVQSYISNYTGLSSAKLDDIPEMVNAGLVLMQDLYDTRSMYIDKNNVNVVVESILDMHRRNLL